MNQTIRPIEEILQSRGHHWVGNGFRVSQLLPVRGGADMRRYSPFLLLDYTSPYTFKGTTEEVGVGAHPHRGFETVTFAFKGRVEHHDNRGHHGVIDEGDVQWMTAGAGILHKEYHEKQYALNDREFHMLQLWVNLPMEHKMTTPGYQALTADSMGRVDLGNAGEAIVVAGTAFGVKGPAHTFSPINMYRVRIRPEQTAVVTEPAEYHLHMLSIGAPVQVNGDRSLAQGELAVFATTAGEVTLTAGSEGADVIVLSGAPINEPIVAAGPFVMNREEEIRQAEKDFYEGAFGTWNF